MGSEATFFSVKLLIFSYLSVLTFVVLARAAMFTCVNHTVSCFCNKCLQNWPTVYTNFTTLIASWFINSNF